MRGTLMLAAVLAAAGTADAQAEKYLRVAYDTSYEAMARAEGYGAREHASSILEALRIYLSDYSRFWLTFTKGLWFALWASPPQGSPAITFLSAVKAYHPAGSTVQDDWGVCVGLTGKRCVEGYSGYAYVAARHSVVFCTPGRAALYRAVTSQEIGHNFSESGHHGDKAHPSSVAKSGPCSVSYDGDVGRGVYTYCTNHVAKFYTHQRNMWPALPWGQLQLQ